MSVHTDFQHDPLEKKARRRGKNSISTLEYENKACFECPCKKIYVLLKNECRNPPPLFNLYYILKLQSLEYRRKFAKKNKSWPGWQCSILIISPKEGLKMSVKLTNRSLHLLDFPMSCACWRKWLCLIYVLFSTNLVWYGVIKNHYKKYAYYNIQFLFVFEQCIPLCFENLILVKLLHQI